MNFHPDDFLALIEEVEQQGGAHLTNEVCRPETFTLDLPIDEDEPKGHTRSTKLYTVGCRRRAKFLVPLLPDAYLKEAHVLRGAKHGTIDPNNPDNIVRRPAEQSDFDFNDESNPRALMGDGSPMLAKVCAVDDAMGLWPRFESAMHTGESFQEP